MDLYRYDSANFTVSVKLVLRKYQVLKETPCGYWVIESGMSCLGFALPDSYMALYRKWVSKTGRKRLCYPTKELAFESFEVRKARHWSILNAQLKVAAIAKQLTVDNPEIQKPSGLCFVED